MHCGVSQNGEVRLTRQIASNNTIIKQILIYLRGTLKVADVNFKIGASNLDAKI